jgi:hypothetical protein
MIMVVMGVERLDSVKASTGGVRPRSRPFISPDPWDAETNCSRPGGLPLLDLVKTETWPVLRQLATAQHGLCSSRTQRVAPTGTCCRARAPADDGTSNSKRSRAHAQS